MEIIPKRKLKQIKNPCKMKIDQKKKSPSTAHSCKYEKEK